MANKVAHFGILLIGMLIFGCRGSEPNPCEGLEPFKASFSMGIHFTGGSGEWEIDTLIVSDTVINRKFITFLAEDGYYTYEWQIGNDPRVFTEQRVSLFFEYPEDSLKIQLIASKKANTACFPQDDGIDTVVQYLTIIEQKDNPVIGRYKGYFESDPDTEEEVEVIYDGEGYQINNINKGCFPLENYQGGIGNLVTYKVIYFGAGIWGGIDYAYPNQCMDPRGWLVLDTQTDSLLVTFSQGARNDQPPYEVWPDIRTYDVYHGKKIN